MSEPRIILYNLSFHINNTSVAFDDICLSFGSSKYGIVGDNGVGKTTLLKLLIGDLLPEKGSIQRLGTLLYLPQSHDDIDECSTVADVLGVSAVISALSHIQSGQYQESDFDTVGNQWDIESCIQVALSNLNCEYINIDTPFHQLSGGEKTKILLARTLIFESDFIVMDEPTNNLDRVSRAILYDFIGTCKKGLIVVSHDRKLLNKMDSIVEILSKGINLFGGNYDYYYRQKQIENEAIEKAYFYAKNQLKKEKHQVQINRQKSEKRASSGQRLRDKSDQPKMLLDKMEDDAQNSVSKINTKNQRILKNAQTVLDNVKENLEIKESITASLDKTDVPNGKSVLIIENLFFKYTDQNDFLINDFSLKIAGPQRIAITGKNGSGKSTFIKLIRNELMPNHGEIKIGVDHVAYLDQLVSFLNHKLSLIDNFLLLNPDAKIFDAYGSLARFQFRNKDAEKKVSELSGGEKMRAGLAISLSSKKPPQLIILDEPTNHLDLRSIKAIELILRDYRGAILAVSHDEAFLNNIGITRMIEMPYNKRKSEKI